MNKNQVQDINSEANGKYIKCVFCFDEKMFEPACVSVASLLDSRDKQDHFELFCIVDKGAYEKRTVLEEVIYRRDDKSIFEIIMAPVLFEDSYEIRGISKATYFRLVIHSLLPNIDKVIYSDADVLFCDSISELWETDVSSFYFAGVKGTNNFNDKWEIFKEYDYYHDIMGVKGKYVNAGLLLMNLELIRNSGVYKNWIEQTKNQYLYQDQDILNISCKDRIGFLPLKYNLVSYLIPQWVTKYYKQGIYSKKEVKAAYKNPVVLHYAGEKPWKKKVYRGKAWWKYVQSQDDLTELFKLNPANPKVIKCSIKKKIRIIIDRNT